MGGKANRPFALSLFTRSVLLGLCYALPIAVLGWLGSVGQGGRFDTGPAVDALRVGFVPGLLYGLSFGVVAPHVSGSFGRRCLIWSSVLVLNIASILIEGAYFAPSQMHLTTTALVFMSVQTVFLAVLVAWIFPPGNDPSRVSMESGAVIDSTRSWTGWLGRFALSSLAYLFFYYLFGAINYALFTRPYYETGLHGLTVPDPGLVIRIELIRAPVIVLSVLPMILAWRDDRKRLGLGCGLLLFMVGGGIPLQQASIMPVFWRLASGWEILLQNGLTGITAARLLGREVDPADRSDGRPSGLRVSERTEDLVTESVN